MIFVEVRCLLLIEPNVETTMVASFREAFFSIKLNPSWGKASWNSSVIRDTSQVRSIELTYTVIYMYHHTKITCAARSSLTEKIFCLCKENVLVQSSAALCWPHIFLPYHHILSLAKTEVCHLSCTSPIRVPHHPWPTHEGHNGGTQPPSPWSASEAVRPAHAAGGMRFMGSFLVGQPYYHAGILNYIHL